MNEKIKFQVTGAIYVVDIKTAKVVHTFHSATEVTSFEKQVMQEGNIIGTSAMCQYPGEQEQVGTVIFRGYTKRTGFTVYDAFRRKMLCHSVSYKEAMQVYLKLIKTSCQTLLTFIDSRDPNSLPHQVISSNKYSKEDFKKGIKHVLKHGLPHGRRFH